MIRVRVKTNKSPLGALRGLPKDLRMAVLNAHRHVVAELKKIAVAETVQKYYLTKGQITKTMTTIPGGFKVSSGMLSLDKYKLTPKTPRRKYSLMGAVRKDSGLKPLGSNAFLMRLPSGKYKPAMRKGRARLPVKVITGPSIAQAVGNDETGELLQQRAEELFTNKVNEYLSRMGVIR